MEPVSGFLATDGKFFKSHEECAVYERSLGLRDRIEYVLSSLHYPDRRLPPNIREIFDSQGERLAQSQIGWLMGLRDDDTVGNTNRDSVKSSIGLREITLELRDASSLIPFLLGIIKLMSRDSADSTPTDLTPLKELLCETRELIDYLIHGKPAA